MFKLSSFIILFLTTNTYAKCFTETDITNSSKLFSYKGKVYDITGYSHPGGSSTLKKTIGKPLEDYVNENDYSFHLTSNSFKKDLVDMYIGDLNDNCTTTEPTPTTTSTSDSTITSTITETTEPTTTEQTTSTSVSTTTAQNFTTTAPTTTMTLLPNETYNCIPFDYNPIILSDVIFDYNPINGEIVPEGGIKLKLTQLEGGSSILTKELFHYGQIDANLKISKGINVISSFYIESEDKNQIMFNMVNNKNNIIIETNFFYKGNDAVSNARYYYPNEILSETYNKYSILWLPDYYEWRFNNLLIRRLYKNQTANFPDSPSIVKFSISKESTDWTQVPYEYAIESVRLQCPITFILNDKITYKEKVQNESSKNVLSIFMLVITIFVCSMIL
jgi:hypothetical protein